MRRLFSQSDWLRFAKAANQTGSFRGIGFVWSSGADPRSSTRPPGRVWPRQRPACRSVIQPHPAQVKEQQPVTENWLRSVKTPPWGKLQSYQSSRVWLRRPAAQVAPFSKKLASFRQLPEETLQTYAESTVTQNWLRLATLVSGKTWAGRRGRRPRTRGSALQEPTSVPPLPARFCSHLAATPGSAPGKGRSQG